MAAQGPSCSMRDPQSLLWCVVAQLLSHVWLSVTPWTAARQASLFFTVSHSLLKFMSIKSVRLSTISSSAALFSFCLQSWGIFSCGMWTLSCGRWEVVPWPGSRPRPPALAMQSLSHWTTREVPVGFVIFWRYFLSC